MAGDKSPKFAGNKLGSPYFIPFNALPGTTLTTPKLNGDNYAQWKQDAMLCLRSLNKLGFINVTIKESDKTSSDYTV